MQGLPYPLIGIKRRLGSPNQLRWLGITRAAQQESWVIVFANLGASVVSVADAIGRQTTGRDTVG